MNDGKPIDETQAETLAAISGNQPAPSISVGPDYRRRRLIRGAAGIAPMVLTLRSGALTASSSLCAAVIQPEQELGANGIIPTNTNVSVGDKCVGVSTECLNGRINGIEVGTVARYPDSSATSTDPLSCVNGGTPLSQNTPVAIISAGSVSSLTG